MFRLSGICFLILAGLCGTLLFWTSQSVQRAEQKLSEVSKYELNEEESFRVLTAEWDYLNRPERLEELTQNNLDLDAPLADQKVFVQGADKIPQPMIPVIPKMKPDNLLQYVSSQKNASVSLPTAAMIEKHDSQDFDKVLSGVVAGDQQ